ncbi:polysaccharide biosynthesis/export family protein [Jannaschia seohaensis]|uniref:Polysaccharide export outer membrane protein n=1 Tax=Jannaschia seohaensis TaxID=475081 RepID=A0A2Y9B2D2_9RHOB|nr:polysaccharide biosynthesis/export family protein [Jannaschia seohaensis]PWJ12876.1 polysaccharide export outer membrane protein [Jannaschia seohaensis]SSA50684.1 polysaccharide export outer membrane protein [Jannaschia seohaensis]
MTVTAIRVPPLAALLFAGLLALVWAGGAAAQGYKVRSGDTLTIEVLQDSSLNRNVLVTPDGTFTFPFAGTVRAGGRTPAEISQQLTQAIASNFAAPPNVFVSVRSLRPEDPAAQAEEEAVMLIYVLGEVNEPGPKRILPGTTFLQALSTTGGFTNFAADKRVQLRRTDPQTGAQGVTVINYRAIAAGAAMSQDIVLTEGDVILVPQRRLFE